MYDNFGLYSCKNCLDPLKLDDNKVKSFRDNLYNSHKLWTRFNVNLHNKKLEKELKNKCMYLPESEWESCHILKNK